MAFSYYELQCLDTNSITMWLSRCIWLWSNQYVRYQSHQAACTYLQMKVFASTLLHLILHSQPSHSWSTSAHNHIQLPAYRSSSEVDVHYVDIQLASQVLLQ